MSWFGLSWRAGLNVHKLRKTSDHWDGSAGGLGFPELCPPRGFAFPLPSRPLGAEKGLMQPKVDSSVQQLRTISSPSLEGWRVSCFCFAFPEHCAGCGLLAPAAACDSGCRGCPRAGGGCWGTTSLRRRWAQGWGCSSSRHGGARKIPATADSG